jgi:hypothetical protein
MVARCCRTIDSLLPNSSQTQVSTLTGGTIGQIVRSRCEAIPLGAGAGLAVSSNAEEFRRRADECYRLSVQVQNPEHKALALYLAGAWVELAPQVERREAAGDRAIDCDPADPQPKDQIE